MSGDWLSRLSLVVSMVAVIIALLQLISAIAVSREAAMAERIKDLYLFSQESLNLMGKPEYKDKEVIQFIEASYGLPLYPSYVSLIRKSNFFIRCCFNKIEYDFFDTKKGQKKKATVEDIAIDIRNFIVKKRRELKGSEENLNDKVIDESKEILNEKAINDFKNNVVLEIRKKLIKFEA
ncbi:hypothetical protein [Neisseria sp. HMSC074B07]|uniref:hypothetical protein n=1 Tax=Neisseria sp. HMSC074B07 TaxID=1715205 RepID=UPI0008A50923|nr:hypothetical protein [Neisseria sp. HMSC074B07]OFM01031.1 hypothetical protein HMPREF2726_03960 [Neisseria sp. HMSC074B07]